MVRAMGGGEDVAGVGVVVVVGAGEANDSCGAHFLFLRGFGVSWLGLCRRG